MNPRELREVASAVATAGAEVALHWQQRHRRTSRSERHKTGPRDLVSEADLDAERVMREVIAQLRADDEVVGEEHGVTVGSSGLTWVIDPIDGTTSYLYDRTDWAVSVAVTDARRQCVAAAVAEPAVGVLTTASRGGGTWVGQRRARVSGRDALAEALVELNLGRPDQQPRAGSMLDALLPQVRDVRRGGSAAAALAQVAAGRADAAWSPGLQPWDGLAGVLLVAEAGGTVGDLSGPSDAHWPDSGDVLAASPALWAALREVLAPVYERRRAP